MTIIYLGVAWLLGIWLASHSHIPLWIWLATGSICTILALLLRKRKPLGLILGAAGFLFLGAGRGEAATTIIDVDHVAHYNGIHDVALEGLVDDEPDLHDRAITFRLRAESLELPGGEDRPIEGYVQVMAPRYPVIPYGARLRLQGSLFAPEEDLDFNYRAYLARQGIYSQMTWPEIAVLEENAGNPIYQAIYEVKGEAQETINRILPEPQAALLSGILLGNDDQIPPELEEQFRTSGLSHIIAISGFNIAILAVILLRGSQPFVGRRYSAWVALGGVAIYAILVGAEASVVRAAIMAAVYIFATRFLGRPTFAPAGLFTAAVLMTLANPLIIWNVGFQLSFAATLGLMIYVNPWKTWIETGAQQIVSPVIAKRLVRFFGDIFAATLAAMLLTLPLVIYHFKQVSIVSPLANFFVLPAQPGVMAWGIIATITGMISTAVGKIMAWTVWPFLSYTISRARAFASLPAASVPATLSVAGLLAIYVLIFGVTWLGWKGKDGRAEVLGRVGQRSLQRAALTLSAIAVVMTITWAGSQPDGLLHVSFLDVGQGAAALVQTPSGRNILIDGGAYSSILNDHIGRHIPFWERDIDLVLATHADEDHVSGLPGVLERYDVGLLMASSQLADKESYQALLDAATENAIPIHQAQRGEIIDVGDGVTLEILNPTGGSLGTAADQNDQSIVMRLVYEDFSLLLTGDAGASVEREMVISGNDVSADVLLAGHHGASSSSSAPFLKAVNPQYIIVSSGEGNRYGHPHADMLERAADISAAVLRTDQMGTIEIISDGQAIWQE